MPGPWLETVELKGCSRGRSNKHFHIYKHKCIFLVLANCQFMNNFFGVHCLHTKNNLLLKAARVWECLHVGQLFSPPHLAALTSSKGVPEA